MQTTSIHVIGADATERAERSYVFFGLFVTALVPAIFWVTLYAGVANFFGYATDAGILALAGAAITTFLTLLFAVLTARTR